MQYQPLTEVEIEALKQKIVPGIVHFKVVEAIEKISSSGNVMIAIKLQVVDDAGTQGLVFDWLTSTEKMQWKLKHFMESVSLDNEYQSGELTPPECLNRSGLVEVKYHKDAQYGEQLKVVDYVKSDNVPHAGDVSLANGAAPAGETTLY